MDKIKKKIGKHFVDFIVGLVVCLASLSLMVFLTAKHILGIRYQKISQEAQGAKKSSSKKGDDLWKIFPNNPYSNQTPMFPTVPAKPAAEGDIIENEPNQTSRVIITGNKYVVKEGDYLWSIAQAAYGDGMMMYRIMQANNLTDPNQIEVGTTLKLPR